MRFSQILAKFAVSLFTRERIEIAANHWHWRPTRSPSLRGSGLKSTGTVTGLTFELSPSLRGSGLKFIIRF